MKAITLTIITSLLSIHLQACKGDMDCDSESCNVGTSTSGSSGDSSSGDTTISDSSASTGGSTHITCGGSTEPDDTTGRSPTTGGEPMCQGITPGACAPTQEGWCAEVEAFCDAEALGESSSMLDFCSSIGNWCDFGADPCEMCATLEQTCIDELRPGEPVDVCYGIVAECMCLGIFHGEQF